MSTILLNTPDSSRDSSAVSTPALIANNVVVKGNLLSPNSKNAQNNNNNNAIVVAGTPQSPRASDTAIVVPRRIFVGGFPPSTTEPELRSYFERFGCVREVKIIRDHAAGAKGKYSYGFITFDTEEEAKKLIAMGQAEGTRAFEFRGRYLNVNEAVKKPPFNKLLQLDGAPPSGVVLRDINGQLFTIQNGYAIFANPDAYAVAQPQPVTPSFPFIVQHPVYMASTAPAAPLKYSQNEVSPTTFVHAQASPATAPLLQQHPATVAGIAPKHRFIFPPLPMQPFNNGHLAHLPPTPIASPVNADSPSKGMLATLGSNPAITNLTNPFPTVLGSANQQIASPYRWHTSTVAGPVTQLVYPGGYPTFLQENAPYGQLPMHQQQSHQQPMPAQAVGNGMVTGYYSPEQGDYNSLMPFDTLHEIQMGTSDRRQARNMYHHRMDSGNSMKD